MRRLAVSLGLAGAAGLLTVPFAGPANALPGFGCTPLFNGGLVAQICTSAMNGQVQGTLTAFGGTPSNIYLTLAKCDAAGTTCTLLADSTTTVAGPLTATPGKYYRTCADFWLLVGGGSHQIYDGCSPLVQAPA
jgi:hypothetical protein